MKRSTNHILTTHTGSLPRPSDLVDMVLRKEEKQPVDEDVLAMRVRSAVAEVVRRQAEVGVTVLNDGEQGKPGYSTYMKDRLTGFEGESTAAAVSGEAKDFPEYTAHRTGRAAPKRPSCAGPIAWKDRDAVRKEIENLQAAVKEVQAEEVFMTAASPGVVPHFMKDQYYGSEEKYLYALADALKEEYDAIHRAGFVLQVDCPDLCMSRHNRFSDLSTKEFKKIAELHVAALNHALRDIPADRVRLHMCWGNYEGPHHLDIPLTEIIDVALKAKVGALSFEGANPRHEHEWVVFKEFHLPDGLAIIPGVIDSTTNFVEHPELVAQRIVRYAEVVGPRERHRGHRLRLRHLRARKADHRSAHRVGQTQVAGRGRGHRLKETLELAGIKSLGQLPSHRRIQTGASVSAQNPLRCSRGSRCGGAAALTIETERKRLNGWNDWNGIHCEQGIFVSIVINTKAKSETPKPFIPYLSFIPLPLSFL